MWRTLNSFYNSDEWRRLRRQLIAERTDIQAGFVIDEYSGELILHDYDIIAHHKEPLTMQNVNDVSISLNPDNIMLVSHRSHNRIHERYGFGNYERKVYIIYGAPCSGKSSYVNDVHNDGDLIADIDLIWQALTNKPYYKPKELKPIAFTLYNTLIDQVKTRAGKWRRAYVITGGAHKGDRERLINDLGAEAILIDSTRQECIERLYQDDARADVREEWEGYINRWFEIFQP